MASFRGRCWPFVDLCQVVSDWKAQWFSWPKGTSCESVESIYVKFMGATCLSEELGRLKKKKMSSELTSLADSRIECLRGRLAISVRIGSCSIASYIKRLRTCEFEGFESVLRGRNHPRHPYHSVGRRYIGMARAAPPTQYTFKAFKLTY